MSVKNSITRADYLDFDKTLNKCMKILKAEKQYKMAFLIIVGMNTGLRISDLLRLRFKDFLGDYIDIKEKKTGKLRRVTINDNIKAAYTLLINRIGIKSLNEDKCVFVSQKRSVYTVRSVNLLLKEILSESKQKLNISSHSMRKTFGRAIFNRNNESEKSLIYLSEIFNHSSIAITRRYLGIRQEEIENIYLSL